MPGLRWRMGAVNNDIVKSSCYKGVVTHSVQLLFVYWKPQIRPSSVLYAA